MCYCISLDFLPHLLCFLYLHLLFFGHICVHVLFFFFSSRRRHTRYWRDWSSDVCSSDLVKLIVIVTERIPRRDVAQMVELANMRGARIIGPNCLGIIVPDVIKMGGIGGPARDAAKAYRPGPVGVISRSGGMTTEMSSTLSAAGLGQSTAVSIGGDAIIGTTYAELMPLFEADAETEAIVIYTEPGGRMEAQLAAWTTEHDSRLPIVAFMAGRFMDEMPGMSFGHAGTIVEGREDTASEKIARLAAAGITVAERIEDIPDWVKQGIAERKGAAV